MPSITSVARRRLFKYPDRISGGELQVPLHWRKGTDPFHSRTWGMPLCLMDQLNVDHKRWWKMIIENIEHIHTLSIVCQGTSESTGEPLHYKGTRHAGSDTVKPSSRLAATPTGRFHRVIPGFCVQASGRHKKSNNCSATLPMPLWIFGGKFYAMNTDQVILVTISCSCSKSLDF